MHAVAQEPRDDHLDETKCDGTPRSDTSSDGIELPTDQKVGDSSSSERADQGYVKLENLIRVAQRRPSAAQEVGDSSSSERADKGLCEFRASDFGGTAHAKHLRRSRDKLGSGGPSGNSTRPVSVDLPSPRE